MSPTTYDSLFMGTKSYLVNHENPRHLRCFLTPREPTSWKPLVQAGKLSLESEKPWVWFPSIENSELNFYERHKWLCLKHRTDWSNVGCFKIAIFPRFLFVSNHLRCRARKMLSFLFADYHRLSSIGGEQALAKIVSTLFEAAESHYGVLAVRLFCAFHNHRG